MNTFLEKRKLVKIISIEVLVCVIAAALIGIGLLFSILKISDALGKVLLSLLTLFIAGLFLLNSINAVSKGNKVGMFAAFMILLSAILFLILIWLGEFMGDFYTAYSYIIVIVSMLSILLDLIIGNYIVLGKSLLAVQIVFYLSIAYIELAVSFAILGNNAIIDVWQIFVLAIILAITLYVVLKVKQKNIAQDTVNAESVSSDGEFVTITKTEYENLKAEIERLREEHNSLVNPATPIAPIAGGLGTVNGNLNGENGVNNGTAGPTGGATL